VTEFVGQTDSPRRSGRDLFGRNEAVGDPPVQGGRRAGKVLGGAGYGEQFATLDRWLRTRIRCMKYKRIWKTDRRRLLNRYIRRMGLLACSELLPDVQRRIIRSPIAGPFRGGRPVLEMCTPVNVGN
jgi:hypothetical protein